MSGNTIGSLFLLFVAAAAWSCAAGSGSGASLTSAQYDAEDLAGVQFDNMYEFLRAHSRVRVGQTGAAVPLRVRRLGSGGTGISGFTDSDSVRASGGGAQDPSMGGGIDESGDRGQFSGAGGSSRFVQSQLYIDDREVGNPISRLRNLAPSQVQELRVLRPSEASSRYGGSGNVGIISIKLKDSAS